MNEQARKGDCGAVARLGIHKSPEDQRRKSMEQRFGGMTDAFLARRGVATDGDSRWKLIEMASRDLAEAGSSLATPMAISRQTSTAKGSRSSRQMRGARRPADLSPG